MCIDIMNEMLGTVLHKLYADSTVVVRLILLT